MTETKIARNEQIYLDYLAGVSIYAIAQKNGISWARVKDILRRKGIFSRTKLSLEESENQRKKATYLNSYCRAHGIKSLPCQLCGSFQNIEKHHVDYSDPYLVIFLCRKHHHIYHETDPKILDGIKPIDVRTLVKKEVTP